MWIALAVLGLVLVEMAAKGLSCESQLVVILAALRADEDSAREGRAKLEVGVAAKAAFHGASNMKAPWKKS